MPNITLDHAIITGQSTNEMLDRMQVFLTFSGTPSFQKDFLKRLPLERHTIAVLRSLQTLLT
jgi:hypothetical protein